MIDTNQIQQLGDTAQAVKNELQPYLPALAIAAAWLGREIRNFNIWVRSILEFIITHGGIGYLFWKLIWNPPKT